jgi:CheY-like chemotaxis protein
MNAGPVLYAEDEEHDVLFLKRAFKASEIQNSLVAVENGAKAIDYLTGCVGNLNPIPALVLLDLNMPYKTGHEVLQWIRAQQSLSGLPVVVLTSSNQDKDIVRAYTNGVSGYVVKPGSPKELESIARALKDDWLIHNRTATEVAMAARS